MFIMALDLVPKPLFWKVCRRKKSTIKLFTSKYIVGVVQRRIPLVSKQMYLHNKTSIAMIHRCMRDMQGIELFMTGEPVFMEDRCDQARSRASIKIREPWKSRKREKNHRVDRIRFCPICGWIAKHPTFLIYIFSTIPNIIFIYIYYKNITYNESVTFLENFNFSPMYSFGKYCNINIVL